NFWKVSLVSGVLLIPYLMWVTFATALNAGVVLLNK
ncbi:MAG: tryptophan-rich sensory protein, partial [candidate division WOR-3 bacterium]